MSSQAHKLHQAASDRNLRPPCNRHPPSPPHPSIFRYNRCRRLCFHLHRKSLSSQSPSHLHIAQRPLRLRPRHVLFNHLLHHKETCTPTTLPQAPLRLPPSQQRYPRRRNHHLGPPATPPSRAGHRRLSKNADAEPDQAQTWLFHSPQPWSRLRRRRRSTRQRHNSSRRRYLAHLPRPHQHTQPPSRRRRVAAMSATAAACKGDCARQGWRESREEGGGASSRARSDEDEAEGAAIGRGEEEVAGGAGSEGGFEGGEVCGV